MAFYLQSGWGHHTRLPQLVASGAELDGVVLSPQHLTDTRVQEAAIDAPGDVLVDPQAYIHSIPDGFASRHENHGLSPVMEVDASARDILSTVSEVIELNDRLGLRRVIAPGPLMSGFRDAWSQLGLSLLATCSDMAEERDVIATVAVDAAAFASWDDVEIWLDLFTRRDLAGVYLVVANETGYPTAWDSDLLAGVLKFIYRLAVLNEYPVIWGYSDIAGLAGLAAGASASASGWFYGARRFARSTWVPSAGGRQPAPRVLLPELLLPVRVDSLTSAWGDVGALAQLDREAEARLLDHDWDGNDSWLQHLVELSRLASGVATLPLGERLEWILHRLAVGHETLRRLDEAGAAVESGLPARLAELEAALRTFADTELA